MRIPRIYLPQYLETGITVEMDSRSLRHVVQVLRLKTNDSLILFNGEGGEYEASLTFTDKRRATAEVGVFRDINRESSLGTHLGLGISKGERMDFALQKAVELGVTQITPLYTAHCVVQLNGSREQKRYDHWHAVLISACEQCGRNTLPVLHTPSAFSHWIQQTVTRTKLIFDPVSNACLSDLKPDKHDVVLCIGPEGGFSSDEVTQALATGFNGISLGPRILRTETAALAAVTAIQSLWGDLR